MCVHNTAPLDQLGRGTPAVCSNTEGPKGITLNETKTDTQDLACWDTETQRRREQTGGCRAGRKGVEATSFQLQNKRTVRLQRSAVTRAAGTELHIRKNL